jgi:DNA polymerase III delta subunit
MAKDPVLPSVKKWFSDFISGKEPLPPMIGLRGNDAYLASEIQKELLSRSYEIEKFDLSADGPSAEWESLTASLGLFSPKKVIWSMLLQGHSKWSKQAWVRFENAVRNCDAENLVLIFQYSNKLKIDQKKLSLSSYKLEADSKEVPFWLKRMSDSCGSILTKEKASFLLSFDFDLLTLSKYVEIWSLGGDFWASKALGWGVVKEGSRDLLSANPAFMWVDAVIERRRKEALRLFQKLLDDGQDPIQLFSLLAKTLRILVLVENNFSTDEQTPYLVQKLRRQNVKIDKARALEEWVKLDFAFKSGSEQARVAMAERFITSI